MQFQPGETNIICTDAQASLRFYRDVLGFTLVEEEAGAYRLSLNGLYYLLLPFATNPKPSWEYCSTPEISFDLMVDDLEAAYQYLKSHNVQFAKPWTKGQPNFFVQDPDGLVLEVVGG